MREIHTKYSKKNPGHYVPAMEHNGTLYISGQLSIDNETGEVVEGGVKEKAAQALKNLDLVLSEAGITKDKVIMCRIYTPDVSYWDDINEVYSDYFKDHKPARAIVPTTPLHHGCLVEIEAVAAMQ